MESRSETTSAAEKDSPTLKKCQGQVANHLQLQRYVGKSLFEIKKISLIVHLGNSRVSLLSDENK